jgi:hypothetical protein
VCLCRSWEPKSKLENAQKKLTAFASDLAKGKVELWKPDDPIRTDRTTTKLRRVKTVVMRRELLNRSVEYEGVWPSGRFNTVLTAEEWAKQRHRELPLRFCIGIDKVSTMLSAQYDALV